MLDGGSTLDWIGIVEDDGATTLFEGESVREPVIGAMLIVILANGSTATYCASPATSKADDHCEAADKLMTKSHSWVDLRQFFEEYRDCDDGAIAEGMSDTVVRLFARRWKSFQEFAALRRVDAAFAKWVLGHIDATCSPDDLKQVAKNARKRCPAGAENDEICSEIAAGAEAALATLSTLP